VIDHLATSPRAKGSVHRAHSNRGFRTESPGMSSLRSVGRSNVYQSTSVGAKQTDRQSYLHPGVAEHLSPVWLWLRPPRRDCMPNPPTRVRLGMGTLVK
jgi:hypothetical protein